MRQYTHAKTRALKHASPDLALQALVTRIGRRWGLARTTGKRIKRLIQKGSNPEPAWPRWAAATLTQGTGAPCRRQHGQRQSAAGPRLEPDSGPERRSAPARGSGGRVRLRNRPGEAADVQPRAPHRPWRGENAPTPHCAPAVPQGHHHQLIRTAWPDASAPARRSGTGRFRKRESSGERPRRRPKPAFSASEAEMVEPGGIEPPTS